jgi:glycosyltransferase involved in cell wall biosynthesis
MRILYLSQYFPPEIGATQTRAWEMAHGLTRAGHTVTILTGMPNHPAGVVPREYRGKLWLRERIDGIDVLRVWVWASPVRTFARRLASYLSYAMMGTLAGLFLARGKYDLVFVTSPPLFVGAAGLVISALRRAPMVFEVRDLWPRAAIELGELDWRWAQRLATWLEELCYRRARRVVVVSAGVERLLLERGLPRAKLQLVPNGVNVEAYRPLPVDRELRAAVNLKPGQFVVVFAGLHGLAQDLETILGAAERLGDETEIVFLLIGDGPRKSDLLERVRESGLSNIVFHDPVADVDLARYLALAQAGVHASRRLEILRSSLPVKLFSYMACELPVLLAMEGEAAELIEKAKAGVVVPPEDPDALATAVLKLRASPDEARRLGKAGRTYAIAHFSRKDLARRLASTLEDVVQGEEARCSG